MLNECNFVLSSGRKCRGVSIRRQDFCRHHLSLGGLRPRPRHRIELYSRMARWRDLRRSVATRPIEHLPSDIILVLRSLLYEGAGGISDRQAGRLIRGMLRRLGAIPPFPSELLSGNAEDNNADSESSDAEPDAGPGFESGCRFSTESAAALSIHLARDPRTTPAPLAEPPNPPGSSHGACPGPVRERRSCTPGLYPMRTLMI
ncbi:hypothetical protein [Paracidobacterium acidisoli]|nr:hypothetical protein [Paracidobacterium acidisoli]MBT9330348.1 hypothetical protein [Paracidobacterium acidisoli]